MTNRTTTIPTQARNLRVGDVFRTQGARFQITSLTFACFNPLVDVTYVGLDRFSGLPGSTGYAKSETLHVEV